MQTTPIPTASAVLSRDDARALTSRVLSFSSADQTRVTIGDVNVEGFRLIVRRR